MFKELSLYRHTHTGTYMNSVPTLVTRQGTTRTFHAVLVPYGTRLLVRETETPIPISRVWSRRLKPGDRGKVVVGF